MFSTLAHPSMSCGTGHTNNLFDHTLRETFFWNGSQNLLNNRGPGSDNLLHTSVWNAADDLLLKNRIHHRDNLFLNVQNGHVHNLFPLWLWGGLHD